MTALSPIGSRLLAAPSAMDLLPLARRLLTLSGRNRRKASIAALSSAAFLILSGHMGANVTKLPHSASVALRKWETRPPSDACFASKYAVNIAGTAFYLPAAPVIAVRAERQSFHLQFNNGVRAICKRAQVDSPIHAQNFSLDFSIPMRGTFCATAKDGWSLQLCGNDRKDWQDVYPTVANLYSPAEYDRTHLITVDAYADFVASRDRAAAGGHPLESAPAGMFDRYANGYWVARNGVWKNDAGEPFTLKCGDATASGMLTCTAGYRLQSGPAIAYHFDAPADRLAAAARTMDHTLHRMLTELSAP